MKVQQNFNYQPAFAMNAILDTRAAYHGGIKMVSLAEELAFKEWAKLQGAASDTFNAHIGPILIIGKKDQKGTISNDFRKTYSIIGKMSINGEERNVNLDQTWLNSEKTFSDFDPIVIIKNHIEKAYKEKGIKLNRAK